MNDGFHGDPRVPSSSLKILVLLIIKTTCSILSLSQSYFSVRVNDQIQNNCWHRQRHVTPSLTSQGGTKWHTEGVTKVEDLFTHENVYDMIYCKDTREIGSFRP